MLTLMLPRCSFACRKMPTYWENERFPKPKQEQGWRLLIVALAFDTFFTILIFGTDARITRSSSGKLLRSKHDLLLVHCLTGKQKQCKKG